MSRARASAFAIIGVGTFSALVPHMASAKVGAWTFPELVRRSDVVVLATVEAIEPYLSETGYERRAATARVRETWFGSPGPQVRFRASRPFGCDTSHAEEGETVLLFLGPPRNNGVRSISSFGRGRFEVRGKDRVSKVLVNAFDVPGFSFGPVVGYEELKQAAFRLRRRQDPPDIQDSENDPNDELQLGIPPHVVVRASSHVFNESTGVGFVAACALVSLWFAVNAIRKPRARDVKHVANAGSHTASGRGNCRWPVSSSPRR
jgi:hypothetical protein